MIQAIQKTDLFPQSVQQNRGLLDTFSWVSAIPEQRDMREILETTYVTTTHWIILVLVPAPPLQKCCSYVAHIFALILHVFCMLATCVLQTSHIHHACMLYTEKCKQRHIWAHLVCTHLNNVCRMCVVLVCSTQVFAGILLNLCSMYTAGGIKFKFWKPKGIGVLALCSLAPWGVLSSWTATSIKK